MGAGEQDDERRRAIMECDRGCEWANWEERKTTKDETSVSDSAVLATTSEISWVSDVEAGSSVPIIQISASQSDRRTQGLACRTMDPLSLATHLTCLPLLLLACGAPLLFIMVVSGDFDESPLA